MRTTNYQSKKGLSSIKTLTLGVTALFLIFALKPTTTLSQILTANTTLSEVLKPTNTITQDLPKYKLGMEIGSNVSGNGHGAFYEGGITFSNKKNVFLIGTCIQKRKSDLCGASFSYMRTILDRNSFSKKPIKITENMDELEKLEAMEENEEMEELKNNKGIERLQLFFFTKAQYIHDASLSFQGVKQEEDFSREKNDYSTDFSNYKTSTLEFYGGFGINLNISKNLTWANSIGFGTYYHMNYIPGMYKDQIAPVMMLKTSLRINNFNK